MRVSEPLPNPAAPDVQVSTGGPVPALEVQRVAGAVGRVMTSRGVGGPALVRLTAADDDNGPLLVQVNLSVGGQPARIQTITPGGGVVLPAVIRLDRQIEARSGGRARPWPDPTGVAPAASRHAAITRRKSCALLVGEPEEAAQVLDAMDYQAHLFADAETGDDAVVYRAGPSGVRLARQHPMRPPTRSAATMTVHPHPTPVFGEADAVQWLSTHGLPFLFFTDPTSERGHLLYRRYDGDLTLLTPLDTIPGQARP